MIITSIEPYYKKDTYKIEIDYDFAFWLYKSEVKKYNLEENKELPYILYEELLYKVVLYRAKQKALNILKYMDRTEKELYEKLKLAGYNQLVISKAMDYVYKYQYLDDRRFTKQYIFNNSKRKSTKQLKLELMRKGITDELIQEFLSSESEIEALENTISKKLKNKTKVTDQEKQKIASYLYRKGFQKDEIWKSLNKIDIEDEEI